MNPSSKTSLPTEDKHSPREKSSTHALSNQIDADGIDTNFLGSCGSVDLLLEHMTDAIILTKSDETIVYVNPAWEQQNRYKLDEVRGLTPAALHAYSEQPVWQTMQAAIQRDETWHGEVRNMRADGSDYETDLTIVPIQNGGGAPLYFVWINRDVTEEKMLAREQERFVTEVSHELRTPLTNIKFYLSLLEKGTLDNQARYIQTLKREAKRLQSITEDMLLISQFDMDKIEPSIESIDLNNLVLDVVAARTKLAKTHEVTIRYRSTSDPLLAKESLLESDNDLLAELLGQLLTNAIVYTGAGGKVEIETSICEKDEQMCCAISVCDSGFGIEASERERIFDRFYRGRSSHKMSISGTGLGLTICQQIADCLGGTLELESRPHIGSTFTFFLPLVDQQPVDQKTQQDSVLSRSAVLI